MPENKDRIISDDTDATKDCAAKRTEEARAFLEEFAICEKMLRMNEYEREYFQNKRWRSAQDGRILVGAPPGETEDAEWKARMFEVRRFVLSMGNCNEKMFLYYHYIHGETVERCAELLGISRRSGFRLKKRALDFAGRKFEKFTPGKGCCRS